MLEYVSYIQIIYIVYSDDTLINKLFIHSSNVGDSGFSVGSLIATVHCIFFI